MCEISALSRTPLFEMDVPPEIESMWIKGNETWRNLAIEQPVPVQWVTGKNGGGVSTTNVHILGTVHNNTANFRYISEVVDAIKPSAVCIEAIDEHRNGFKAAAASPRMQPLIKRLIETPVLGIRQVQNILSTADREQYERGLLAGHFGLGSEGEARLHYLYGQIPCNEFIAAAFFCSKMKLSLVAIDTSAEGRSLIQNTMRKDRKRFPLGVLWISSYDPITANALLEWILSGARDNSDAAEFKSFLVSHMVLPLNFNQHENYNQAVFIPQGIEANRRREGEMTRRIRLLCSGGITGKTYKTVLVITGRNHVTPLIQLLKEPIN